MLPLPQWDTFLIALEPARCSNLAEKTQDIKNHRMGRKVMGIFTLIGELSACG